MKEHPENSAGPGRRRASAKKITAEECARIMGAICYEKRAETTRVLDLRNLCPYADFLVIATAGNRPQMRGIMREVDRTLRDNGWRPLNGSVPPDEHWSLLDFGDVIVHLFTPEAREFYGLEQMWADAPELEFERRTAPEETAANLYD